MEFTQRQDAKTLLDRDDRRAERSRSEVQHLGMEAWPQTKGKIESTIRFIKSSFWPGLSFDSLAELNRQTRLWCDEVNRRLHGTTREAPLERFPREALTPLNGQPAYDTS
jgi:transposase